MRNGRFSVATINSNVDPGPADLLAFARLVIEALTDARVDYALGGALAVAAYAEARSTQDVDLAINLPLERVHVCSDALARRSIVIPADLMVDLLLETRGDVALVAYHVHWGYKVELFPLRPGDALRASTLARRRLVDLGPPLGTVHVHAPEDLILYKLSYFGLSRQQKHTRDIRAILLGQKTNLDQAYLSGWVSRLGLDAVWQYMLTQARGIESE